MAMWVYDIDLKAEQLLNYAKENYPEYLFIVLKDPSLQIFKIYVQQEYTRTMNIYDFKNFMNKSNSAICEALVKKFKEVKHNG